MSLIDRKFHSCFRCRALAACLLLWFSSVALRPALAQPVGDLPRPAYYVARELFRSGNIPEASRGFQSVLNNSARTSTDGWIDSIPPLVMLGECYFQQGNLSEALEHYNAALSLVLNFPGWLDQFSLVDAPLAVTDPAAKGIQWFRVSRPSRSLSVPEGVQLLIDLAQARADDQGNTIAPVLLTARLDSSEVLKTLGVALMRRWQILGPLANQSPLTNPAIQYFSQNLQQPHAWAQTSWSALHGLALLARDESLASQQLRASTWIRDQFDYFLSPLLLIAQGRMAAMKGQYQAAIVHFQDASILAAQYDQHELLGESMIWLSDCGCANERIDLADSLRVAVNWTSKKSPFSLMACLSGLAELSLLAGDQAEAKKSTARIATALRSRDVSLPRFQARLAFLECLLALREKQAAPAWNRLSAALSLMRGNAAMGAIPERIFQKQLALDLLASGQITQLDADQILSQLLAEPSQQEWEVQPLETLSALTTSAIAAYLRWLRTSDPQDSQAMVARMDRVQQQQFYEALPLGGREFAWQTAVTLPLDQLPADIRGTVQAEMIRLPGLRQIPGQIVSVLDQLRRTPPPLDDRQLKPDSRQNFSQWTELNDSLQNLLLAQSVSRTSLRRFAPASWNPVSTQQRLSPEDLLLGFVVAGDELFAVAQNQQRFETWKIGDALAIQAKVHALYRQIGLVKTAGAKVPADILQATAQWRLTAQALLGQLVPPECQSMIQDCRRLIIVPHGFLWTVPFELLIDSSGSPLIAGRSITYVPTLGSLPLAYASRTPQGSALAVLGNIFSLDKSVNGQLAGHVAAAGQQASLIHLDQKVFAPSSTWLRSHTAELLVLHPLNSAQDGWNVRLIPIDKSEDGNLIDWLDTSQATPTLTLLPAMNTSVRAGEAAGGNDLYQTACGMLYGGSRGLISRWQVGGPSSSAYLERVRQEVHGGNTISGAMRRATIAVWAEQFSTSEEPILKPTGSDAPALTSGEHPLLWGSYMALGDFLTTP